jgi:hypothetical protein
MSEQAIIAKPSSKRHNDTMCVFYSTGFKKINHKAQGNYTFILKKMFIMQAAGVILMQDVDMVLMQAAGLILMQAVCLFHDKLTQL